MPFYFGGNEAENEGKGLVLNEKKFFQANHLSTCGSNFEHLIFFE